MHDIHPPFNLPTNPKKKRRPLVLFPTFVLPSIIQRSRPSSLFPLAHWMEEIASESTKQIPVVDVKEEMMRKITEPLRAVNLRRVIWEKETTYRIPAVRRQVDTKAETKPLPMVIKRSSLLWIFILLREILYLILAIEVGLFIWTYLEGFLVYRIVAEITLAILWANFASSAVRNRGEVHIAEKRKRRPKKYRALDEDTDVYLQYLRDVS